MCDNRKFADGENIYVNSEFLDEPELCKIVGFIPKEATTCKPVYFVQSLDENAESEVFAATEDCIFNSKEKAMLELGKTAFDKFFSPYNEDVITITLVSKKDKKAKWRKRPYKQ